MNKKKDNKNLTKIISITKTKSINKLPDNQKTKNKKITNIYLRDDKIANDFKKSKQEEKRLEISGDEGKKYKNIKEENNENNYFDFQAHFKYNDLVEALSSLKKGKNQIISHTDKTTEDSNKGNLKDIKQNNYRIISRNVKMNNYSKYLEFLEESKNKVICTDISGNTKNNKTSYFPQTESIKNNILFKFKKYEERKNKKEKKNIAQSKSKSKSKSKEKKYSNKSGKFSKENNSSYNRKKYINLITIPLIKKNKIKNVLIKKSNTSNRNISKNIINKSDNKTNSHSKNKNISKNKKNEVKKKSFQKNKNPASYKSNFLSNSYNNKIINKKKDKQEKNIASLNKKIKAKEKQTIRTNIIKNTFNLNNISNNNLTPIQKVNSTSLSRNQNKQYNRVQKIKDINQNNNIKTVKKNDNSKKKKKNSIINLKINLSKPEINKKKNIEKKFNTKSENIFANPLNSFNKAKKIFYRKANQRQKNSIKNSLTINITNDYIIKKENSNSKFKQRAKSNSKQKKKDKNKNQIIDKEYKKDNVLKPHNILITKTKKEKTLLNIKTEKGSIGKNIKKNNNKHKIKRINEKEKSSKTKYSSVFQIMFGNNKTYIANYKNKKTKNLNNTIKKNYNSNISKFSNAINQI